HMVKGFEFPPKAIREEITAAAKEAEIKLSIAGPVEADEAPKKGQACRAPGRVWKSGTPK
ncbi:MAG: hypothetical protein ACR2RV_26565, partial [Verrucomicrobiales bacterium]